MRLWQFLCFFIGHNWQPYYLAHHASDGSRLHVMKCPRCDEQKHFVL
jgi:hypothetical protein